MKKFALLMTVLMSMCLASCGEKMQEADLGMEDKMSETTEASGASEAGEAKSETAQSSGGGGYEPSADERVPGISLTQEELDKANESAQVAE